MNNSQFRKLVAETPISSQQDGKARRSSTHNTAPHSALGSRLRSSIPMTPRSVVGPSGNDFARQVAERNAQSGALNAKTFRSSAAPKGVKLGSGYQDRTQLRKSGEEDEKAVRVQALEDLVKLGQMEYTTFLNLRDEIIGGDVKNVHLVKGLDFKLLERVRKGEDVLASTVDSKDPIQDGTQSASQVSLNEDSEFERLEERTYESVSKEMKPKRGELAHIAGQKRTRNDILRELRASRLELAADVKAQQPSLGPRFSRVGQSSKISRIEKDDRGREILICTDADGNTKRKIRRAKVDDNLGSRQDLLMPDKNAAPLGINVPPIAAATALPDNGDDDIFEGVGTDYNPLGNEENEDIDSEVEGTVTPTFPSRNALGDLPTVPPVSSPHKIERSKRNYFGDMKEQSDNAQDAGHSRLADPTILAALKKASTINPIKSITSQTDDEVAKLERRRKMLETQDRDLEDMDMGFGGSRFGDEEDGGDKRIKLSVWGGEIGEAEGKDQAKSQRKRGSKKKKGDVNNAAHVLGVMEERKKMR